jgi:hypothetical protein
MPESPILGAFGVSRSTNVEDAQEINLFLEVIESKDGKSPGFLMMTPGLDRLVTVGLGGMRAGGLHVMGGVMYAVSGSQLWAISPSLVTTFIGNLSTSTGTVWMVDNGTQLMVVDGYAGYLTTAELVASGGEPLTGGVIASAGAPPYPGGSLYAVGDTVTLNQQGGVQSMTAIITITAVATINYSTTVNGVTTTATYVGVATKFSVTQGGLFSGVPTTFTQNTTSGSGAGITITSPTFGPSAKLGGIIFPFDGTPSCASYQDGFGVVGVSDTNKWYQSDLDDLSNWQPLNFSLADATPDNIIDIIDLSREFWVMKEAHIEIWVNAGVAGFTFQRATGVFIETGIAAAASLVKAGQQILWLAQNLQGDRFVVMSEGYMPVRKSNHPIEQELTSYSVVDDAIGYVYQQEGHVFYVLTFPTENVTWVLDLTTTAKMGYPCWHQRASYSNGQFTRHVGNCFAVFQVSGSTYFPKGVELTTVPAQELATATGLTGLPASFTTALFSVWLYMPDVAGEAGLIFSNQTNDAGPANGGLQIQLYNDVTHTPQIVVNAYDASSAPIVQAAFDFSGWSDWVWLAISIDTATQTLQVYVGEGGEESTLSATTEVWSSTNPIAAAQSQPWHLIPASAP